MPPGTGISPAAEPLDSPGGEFEQIADVARFPPGVGEGVVGLTDLQPGQLLAVFVDGRGEAAQQARAVCGGHRRPDPLGGRCPAHSGVDLGRGGGRDDRDDFFGRRVEYLVLGGHGVPHRRSKERRSSQSVTAASNASSSTRAMLR